MDKQSKAEQNFTDAYNSYGDAIFRFCFFRIYDRERAKEIMQEVFMRTWDYQTRGNRIKNIRAFLYTTARNIIIDESRKQKDISLELLQNSGFEPVDKLDLAHLSEQMDMLETIHRLDEKYKEAIILRYVDGFSIKEIARIIGESENVISVRIHRGLKQLREILAENI
jgi:RNA polymerase sigma-70 factor (ECF subfamily)